MRGGRGRRGREQEKAIEQQRRGGREATGSCLLLHGFNCLDEHKKVSSLSSDASLYLPLPPSFSLSLAQFTQLSNAGIALQSAATAAEAEAAIGGVAAEEQSDTR